VSGLVVVFIVNIVVILNSICFSSFSVIASSHVLIRNHLVCLTYLLLYVIGAGPLLAAFLSKSSIVVARTMEHQVLVMFSIGFTRGKWNTLLSTLFEFHEAYMANDPVQEFLPEIYAADPARYRCMGLADLCTTMWAFMRQAHQAKLLNDAFATLPEMVLLPRHAAQVLVNTWNNTGLTFCFISTTHLRNYFDLFRLLIILTC
jgi:hypothetical protein